MIALAALIRKDLELFFVDRRSVIMAFAVPIAIASFFGSIFSGPRAGAEPPRVAVAFVDQDGSNISRAVVASAQADRSLRVSLPTAEEARAAVRSGTTTAAVIFPKGFGDAAGHAFFVRTAKPELEMLFDPSRAIEVSMVRGLLAGHVMQAVSREMFGGVQGRAVIEQTLPEIDASAMDPERKRLLSDLLRSVQRVSQAQSAGGSTSIEITTPYTVHEDAVTAGDNVPYNGYAHSFAGMGVQFLLFAAANMGVEILLERQRGLWKRLRSAPVSRQMLLAGKAASMIIVALITLLVSFAFAMVVFGVRIQGSVVGFLAVSLACSVMASAFGLLIAALGHTPAATRGMTSLAVLLMVMLGGAWVPTFIFPRWLQTLTLVVPARWAVDGLDAMSWRGIGLNGALAPTAVLLAFAAAFWVVAVWRFRWEEA
jgi:ABC-2 type transport system permease protein